MKNLKVMYTGLALVALFVSICSLFVSDYSSKQRNYENIEAQKQLQEDAQQFTDEQRVAQNEWDLELWNMQNEYNLPVNQFARMSEAGINPNAAAQAIVGGTSTFAPTAESGVNNASAIPSLPSAFPSNLSSLGDVFNNLFKNQTQTTEAEKNRSEVIFNEQKVSESQKRIDLMAQEIDASKNQCDIARMIANSQVGLNESQVALNYEKCNVAASEFVKNIASVGVMKSEEVKNYAHASLFNAQAETEEYVRSELSARANMENNEASYYSSLDRGQQLQNLNQNMLNQFTAFRLEVSKALKIDVNSDLATQIVEAAAYGNYETIDKLLMGSIAVDKGVTGLLGKTAVGVSNRENWRRKYYSGLESRNPYNSFSPSWNPYNALGN